LKINNEKRVFIGIPIGYKIKSILPSIKSALNSISGHIKWVPIENMHLTLYFLGNTSDRIIPDVIQSLKNEVTTKYFKLIIKGTGVFPSFKSPKVLWLGIDKGIAKLTLLQYQVENSVRKFNENSEELTFIPHITFARIRQVLGKIDVLPFLNTVYSPIELDVNSIYLYETQFLPEGVQYSVLNAFPLN